MKTFAELRKISVLDKMKKKGRFNYLSWAYAVDVLLQEDKDANWEFKAPQMFGETMMVFCTVTAFGHSRTAFLPVMNMSNQAIANPDASQVNKAMQRCLVKAIALHGIALYIYEGEDLPDEEEKIIITPNQGAGEDLSSEEKEFIGELSVQIIDLFKDDKKDEAFAHLQNQNLENEQKLYLWTKLPSNLRSFIKKKNEELKNA